MLAKAGEAAAIANSNGEAASAARQERRKDTNELPEERL
jgi:hypothetical protein